MKADWQINSLNNVCDVNPEQIGKSYPFDKIFYIDISSVATGSLKNEIAEIDIRNSPGRARRIVKDGDSIIATVRPNLRSFLYLKNPNRNTIVSTGFAVLRPKHETDKRFLYYLTTNQSFTDYLVANTKGSAYPAVTSDIFEKAQVLIPPLPTQQRIAGVLSAYDDLIENNTRRIKILEEMAQRIYKEWFVHFKFPGHEKTKLVNSPLGKIPERWEVKAIEDAIEFNPKEALSKEAEKPYAAMENLSNDSMIVTLKEYRTGNSGSKYRNGDTLFARITPCLENGKTGFVQFLDETEIGIGSTEFIVLRSKTVCPEYVYLLARSEDFRNIAIKSMAGASGRQRVRLECFNEYPIVQPSKEIIVSFSNCISTFFKQIFDLDKINANLRRTRDLLLPKLINGEIEV